MEKTLKCDGAAASHTGEYKVIIETRTGSGHEPGGGLMGPLMSSSTLKLQNPADGEGWCLPNEG